MPHKNKKRKWIVLSARSGLLAWGEKWTSSGRNSEFELLVTQSVSGTDQADRRETLKGVSRVTSGNGRVNGKSLSVYGFAMEVKRRQRNYKRYQMF